MIRVRPFLFDQQPVANRVIAVSAGYTLAAQLLKNGVQTIQIIIVGRMLGPEAFGIAAMIAPILALALLVQDLGLTQVTIQRPNLTSSEATTIFWYNLILTITVSTLVVISASAVADFYRVDDLRGLVVAMGAVCLTYGVGAQHIALLTRTMNFKLIAMLECLSVVAGFCVSFIYAYYSRTFWPIFAGMAVVPIVTTLGAWVLVDWRPGLPTKLWSKRDLMRFGVSVAGSNITNFFARNLDNVLIGKVWGSEALGLYDRAYKLLTFPLQAIANPMGRVMVPSLASALSKPSRYVDIFQHGYRTIVIIMSPGVIFMISSASISIPLLFGEAWGGAVPIFQALGIAALFQPINNPSGWLLISQARGKDLIWWGLFTGLTSACGIIAGLSFGPLGVAIGYSVSELLRTPILWVVVAKVGPVRLKNVLSVIVPALTSAAVSLTTNFLFIRFFPIEPWISLILLFLLTGVTYFATISCFAVGRLFLIDSVNRVITFFRWKFR